MSDTPVRRLACAWAVVCTLASSIWCLTAASRLGPTFDEPVYIAAGVDRWRQGGIGELMRLGTMPLAVDVVTLPVWLAERWRSQPYQLASDGRGRVVDARDLNKVLRLARAGTLIFWWILLASAWRLAAGLAGPLGGALAVTWLAVEPSLLAHATLATTDVAVTAMLMAFAASLRVRGPDAPRWSGWVLPGFWFGLAILAKASAVVFAPLIVIAFAVVDGGGRWADVGRRLARMSVVALAMAFLYCGSDWRTEDSFVDWAKTLPPGPIATTVVAVAERLPIFSNAGEGIVQQIKHNIRGHDTYLLGRAYARAVWFYFPVVLTIKVSLAVLAGLVALLVLDRRALANGLVIAAAAILVCSPTFRVQLGVRMILPVVALLAAGLGVAFARALRTADLGRHAVVIVLTGLLTAWSAVVSGHAWPDAIPYVNELWGGSSRAPLVVSDSNYDWGQGLPALRDYLAPVDGPVDVWYWGTDPDVRLAPFRRLDIRALAPADEAALVQWLSGRTLAVSATLLYGAILSPDARVDEADRAALATAEALRRLLRTRDATRVGTFFVYHPAALES